MSKRTDAAKVGGRVRWIGDMANGPRSGEIVSLEGGWMFIRWDGETAPKPHPLGLLDSPRWGML